MQLMVFHQRAHAHVRGEEALNTLPNIIMPYQRHVPLSGLAVPAGVDWEEIRAHSLAYKKSCKQSPTVAAERGGGGTSAPRLAGRPDRPTGQSTVCSAGSLRMGGTERTQVLDRSSRQRKTG